MYIKFVYFLFEFCGYSTAYYYMNDSQKYCYECLMAVSYTHLDVYKRQVLRGEYLLYTRELSIHFQSNIMYID